MPFTIPRAKSTPRSWRSGLWNMCGHMTSPACRARRSTRALILPHGKATISCSRRRSSMSYARSRRDRIINDALRRDTAMRRRRGRHYSAGLILSLFLSSRRGCKIPWKTALEVRWNRDDLSCEFFPMSTLMWKYRSICTP